MTQPKEQAFPCTDLDFYDEKWIGGRALPGLNKREYFAAIALQGLLANSEFSSSMDSEDEEYGVKAVNWYAKRAVRCADLLIAELNKAE